jgi:hypothetical protein
VAGGRREHCRDCKRHIDECGKLSQRGKCMDCGVGNAVAAAQQIEAREGPYYDKWRASMVEVGRRVA